MKSKVAGIALTIGSLYYILAEVISAAFFKASIGEVVGEVFGEGEPNASSDIMQLKEEISKLIADARRRGEIEYFSIGKRNGIRYTQQQIEEWIKTKTKREDSLTDIERRAIEYVRANPLKI